MPSLTVVLTLMAAVSPFAAALGRQAPPIQDNSFLIEEAYNQDAGIVQHIVLLQRATHGSGWMFGFTQEWPFPGQRHQVGFTVPVLRAEWADPNTTSGPGDFLLNYRFQAIGGEGAALWLAPRASLVVPSGSWRKGLGDGSVGLQLAIPMSITLAPTLAAHLNGSVSLHHRARNTLGAQAAMASFAGGASLVWLPRPGFNLLTELVIEDGAEVVGSGTIARDAAVILAPGIRWAHNLRNGVQVVPGIAYAIGLGDAKADSAVLFYLSVEHRFKR